MPVPGASWDRIKQLLDDAAQSDKGNLRDTFQHGTPKQKLELLKEYGITIEDLVEIHDHLEKIFHDSPLRWWWW